MSPSACSATRRCGRPRHFLEGIVGKKERLTATEVSRAMLVERSLRGVEQLRKAALAIEKELSDELGKTAPELRESAYNLAHYLAVRRHDVRELQRDLSCLGLSSLGRMEAHVMASLNAVLEVLYPMRGQAVPDELKAAPPINFDSGDGILAEHAVSSLGPRSPGRNTRIMVTMPSEAATDPELIHGLLAHGMDIMRVNCAHDDAHVWGQMVQNLRKAEGDLGRTCKVSFDLAGPKLRTGPIKATEGIARWRPQRNELGQSVAPANVCFSAAPRESDGAQTVIPVHGDMPRRAKAGDTVSLVDTRDRKRNLKVVAVTADACVCEADTSAYVTRGTPLQLRRRGKLVKSFEVGELPPSEQAIELEPGDILDLVKGDVLGRNAIRNDVGTLLEPAQVGCALAEVFSSVRVGERVFFDDGKIAGRISHVSEDRIRVEITNAVGGSAKLRGEKGINLPDSDLQLPALTPKDFEDLAFAVKHGDMVAMSFVQRSQDIEELISELDRLGAGKHGVVLKIETGQAFERLPILLIAAMRHAPLAVMVARGDLGVEVGFERLSEVQEEILWMCEAAHVPVIWATQVLESLAKGGMPSRAEVTDAAMSSRAECVMLNKGPYILQTIDFLRNVLSRMESHQAKKTSMLRKLSISGSRKSAELALDDKHAQK
jgi:pyruvate kinase